MIALYPYLLEQEALKYKTFREFEKAYIIEIKHGLYWHLTDDPHFRIDNLKGPRDMSSLNSKIVATAGALMITSDLDYWVDYYKEERHYAAIIDMSKVPSNYYYQVNRGFGNEFFVSNANKAKVLGVFPVSRALKIDRDYSMEKPQSREELHQFYETAHGFGESYSFLRNYIVEQSSPKVTYNEDGLKIEIPGKAVLSGTFYHGDLIYDLYPELEDETIPDNVFLLEWVDVKKEYRRQGLASILMNTFLNIMKSKRVEAIITNASPTDYPKAISLQNLIKFYKNFGFKVIQEEPNNAVMILRLR